jgi:epoxyqueuosine reductase
MNGSLKESVRQRLISLGFDDVGFTTPNAIPDASARLEIFLGQGRQGDMEWLARNKERRGSPNVLWPDVRSIIVAAINYGPASDPLELTRHPERGTVSVYARGRDYHDVLKSRLKSAARALADEQDVEVKVFVDTAPVMEKPLASAAGLGWLGKHTNLVSRNHGSWLFLGAIFTTLDLEADEPHTDHCGECHACIDVCPTNAFVQPYQLDARKCISYLTIEHKGHIDAAYREAIGNRIYGCDDCLTVCPWNKFASRASEAAFHPRAELNAPLLRHLVKLDDVAFRQVFAGSPIKRTGRDRFIRNVLIAIGNSGDGELAVDAEAQLNDPSPLVRAMAVWALGRLLSVSDFVRHRSGRMEGEPDQDVVAEWMRPAN